MSENTRPNLRSVTDELVLLSADRVEHKPTGIWQNRTKNLYAAALDGDWNSTLFSHGKRKAENRSDPLPTPLFFWSQSIQGSYGDQGVTRRNRREIQLERFERWKNT